MNIDRLLEEPWPWAILALIAIIIIVSIVCVAWDNVRSFGRSSGFRELERKRQSDGSVLVKLTAREGMTPALAYGHIKDRDYAILTPEECKQARKTELAADERWDHVIARDKSGKFFRLCLHEFMHEPMFDPTPVSSDTDIEGSLVLVRHIACATLPRTKRSTLEAAA